jgi:hypothetical protein
MREVSPASTLDVENTFRITLVYVHIKVRSSEIQKMQMVLQINLMVEGMSRRDHVHGYAMLPDELGVKQFWTTEKHLDFFIKPGAGLLNMHQIRAFSSAFNTVTFSLTQHIQHYKTRAGILFT